MLIRSPRSVRWGATALGDVSLIVIERDAARLVEEWGDVSATPVYVDVPRVSTRARIERRLSASESITSGEWKLGHESVLVFGVGGNGTDADVSEWMLTGVMIGVRYRFERDGVVQILTIAGADLSGLNDPLVRVAGVRTPTA